MQTDVETPATRYVVDSSAVLAVILQEPGKEMVEQGLLAGASMSTVNVTEVLTRLLDIGLTELDAMEALDSVKFERVAFIHDHALAAALLRPLTRSAGLSLGDRACLALAAELGVPAMTADRSWAGLKLDIPIQVIR